jgi:hypothetical protein
VALGQVFSVNVGFPCQSTFHLLSTIIFTITRGWHNRPGVAAVPIVSQTKKTKISLLDTVYFYDRSGGKIYTSLNTAIIK